MHFLILVKVMCLCVNKCISKYKYVNIGYCFLTKCVNERKEKSTVWKTSSNNLVLMSNIAETSQGIYSESKYSV